MLNAIVSLFGLIVTSLIVGACLNVLLQLEELDR